MKKQILTLCGAALLILNLGVFFCPEESARPLVLGLSAAIGAAVLITARFPGKKSTAPAAETDKPSPVPIAPPPVASTTAEPSADAAVLGFLALLQENGRLMDFVREDISQAADVDLGSAARVVHDGCARVFKEHFTIEPIRAEAEGEPVTIEAGYDTSSHRLIGSVPENPPYQGTLIHPGWKATEVRLPKISNSERPVIAPAEIQITNS